MKRIGIKYQNWKQQNYHQRIEKIKHWEITMSNQQKLSIIPQDAMWIPYNPTYLSQHHHNMQRRREINTFTHKDKRSSIGICLFSTKRAQRFEWISFTMWKNLFFEMNNFVLLDMARNIVTTQIITKIELWMNNNDAEKEIIMDDFKDQSTSGSSHGNAMITFTCTIQSNILHTLFSNNFVVPSFILSEFVCKLISMMLILYLI